jgi:putative ABC transport system ATP-binding protein
MSDQQIKPIVQVEGLGKQVNNIGNNEKLILLQDVNFSIFPGESVAIVGPSGSGKSTLLGLLAGLDISTSGQVRIGDVNLQGLDEDARAKLRGDQIGFVFQSFQLLDNFTALENVMLPLEIAGNGQAKVLAETVLARVGLAQRLHHYPKQLSGGEQQRVAIARAFAPQPKLLFADEPTGNLDRDTGERIIELLFELNRERHTTLILVTHDEALAKRCCRQFELIAGCLSIRNENHMNTMP